MTNDGPAVKNVSYKQNVSNALSERVYRETGAETLDKAFELTHCSGAELMRTRYCIKYELGMCPKMQGAKTAAGARRLLLYNLKCKVDVPEVACNIVIVLKPFCRQLSSPHNIILRIEW